MLAGIFPLLLAQIINSQSATSLADQPGIDNQAQTEMAQLIVAMAGGRSDRAMPQAALNTTAALKSYQVHQPASKTAGNYHALIERIANAQGVDVALVKSVVKNESNFNAQAVSQAGAQGLMQLMPGTARSLGVKDSFNPEQNIWGGVSYLKKMLDKYQGNESLALAAYNAGPGTVDKYGGVPPYRETQNYIHKVLRDRQLYV